MTLIPRSADEVLPDESPKVGSVSQANAASAFMRDVAIDANQFWLSVQNATMQLSAERSQAVASVTAKLEGRLHPGAVTLQDAAEAAADAFSAYAAQIDEIHRHSDAVVRNIDDALTSIRMQSGEISEIAAKIRVSVDYSWREGAPGALPHPVLGASADALSGGQRDAAEQNLRAIYEHPWMRAAVLWQMNIEEIEREVVRWNGLISDRQSAEAKLLRSLSETTLGRLISLSENSGEARRFTISTALTGELWGVVTSSAPQAMEHPLLERLIGRASGARLWDSPPDPAVSAANWAALTEAERAELIAAVPGVIGNLPGLPYAVRDAANRETIKFAQQHPHLLSPEQLRLMADLQEVLKREAAEIQRHGEGRPPIRIVALDAMSSVPKAAVSYGDLDSASHITWEIPGMNNDAHLALNGWDKTSRGLYRAQNNVSGFVGVNAVVAWLGYDTPGLPQEGDFGVLSSAAAQAGATRLTAELDGEHAARSFGAHGLPYRNVLAHSYGTTVATIALTMTRHKVDALIMLGSAGIDTEVVRTLDDLKVNDVAPGQRAIYTANAAGDHLAPAGAALSRRGLPGPEATAFGLEHGVPVYGGALSFSVEGDAARGLLATNGHSTIGEGSTRDSVLGMRASEGHGYLDKRTQSLSNVAQITTQRIDSVLQRSFTVTETQQVELVAAGGTVTPIRTKNEAAK